MVDSADGRDSWLVIVYISSLVRYARSAAYHLATRLLRFRRFRGAIRAVQFTLNKPRVVAGSYYKRGSVATPYLSDLIKTTSAGSERSTEDSGHGSASMDGERLPHGFKACASSLLYTDANSADAAADAFAQFVLETSRRTKLGFGQMRAEVFRLAARAEEATDVSAAEVLHRAAAAVHELHAAYLVPIASPRDALFFPSGTSSSMDRLLRYLRSAKTSVDVCVYAISDNELSAELKQLHCAGITVRIVSDHEQAFNAGAKIFSLAGAGVSAVVDNEEPMQSPAFGGASAAHPGGWGSPTPKKLGWHPQKRMHHKFCIIDSKVLLTGSFNWTWSARARNCENLLVTADADAVRLYTAEFERLLSSFAAPGEVPNEATKRLEAVSPQMQPARASIDAIPERHLDVGGKPAPSALAALDDKISEARARSKACSRSLGRRNAAKGRGPLALHGSLSRLNIDEAEQVTASLLSNPSRDVVSQTSAYRALIQRINPRGDADASWLFATAARLAAAQLAPDAAKPPALATPAAAGLPPGLASAPRNEQAKRNQLCVTLNSFCCVVEEELMRRRQHTEAVLFFPSERSRQQLCALLATARHTLDCAVFTLSDERLADELLAAHERGVAVRLITDDVTALTPDSQVFALAQAGIETVVDSEIEVWRSQGRSSSQRDGGGGKETVSRHMHHKFCLIDGTLITGSFNWTFSASFSNCENCLITDDVYHVRKYACEFERLWTEFKRSTQASRGEAAARIQAIMRGIRGRDHAYAVLLEREPSAHALLAEGSERFKPLQMAQRKSIAKASTSGSQPPGLGLGLAKPPGL